MRGIPHLRGIGDSIGLCCFSGDSQLSFKGDVLSTPNPLKTLSKFIFVPFTAGLSVTPFYLPNLVLSDSGLAVLSSVFELVLMFT
jgi:hypothetical protein